MKKVLLLFICCLCLSGCNKENVEKESNEDYSKKTLICTVSNTSNNKSDSTLTFYFEKDGTLKKAYNNLVTYFDTEEEALNYYQQFHNIDSSMKIDGKIVTSSTEGNIPSILKMNNRGTFEKEKQFWENDGYDCQIQDAD